MVGAGCGVLVLFLIILIMCASVCYLIADRGKSYTITTDIMYRQQTLSGDRENPEWQRQSEFNVQYLAIRLIIYPSLGIATETIHLTLSSRHNTSESINERGT